MYLMHPLLDIKEKMGPSWTIEDQSEKVMEEATEVVEAPTAIEAVKEAMDTVQASIGLLDMAIDNLRKENPYIEKELKALNMEHLKKLLDREWTFKNILILQDLIKDNKGEE